jgi:RNase P subunit RPR2
MPTFNDVRIKQEIEIDVDIDFEVYCEKCGAGICNNANTRSSYKRGMAQVTITPCENCLKNAYEEGKQEGHDEAKNEIYDKAFDEGVKCGQEKSA